MITAVDTNVLMDVLWADPKFGLPSRNALRAAISVGSLIASEVVWAETSALFGSEADATQAFGELRLRLIPLGAEGAYVAGTAWGAYRRRGGKRTRMVADFLIGAHAQTHADQLLTRDAGFYRIGFKQLKLVDPSAS